MDAFEVLIFLFLDVSEPGDVSYIPTTIQFVSTFGQNTEIVWRISSEVWLRSQSSLVVLVLQVRLVTQQVKQKYHAFDLHGSVRKPFGQFHIKWERWQFVSSLYQNRPFLNHR